jgi:hypothetical protein
MSAFFSWKVQPQSHKFITYFKHMEDHAKSKAQHILGSMEY